MMENMAYTPLKKAVVDGKGVFGLYEYRRNNAFKIIQKIGCII